MTEKDLDAAIEKCERIMEMDTRTLKNPESENGWIFEKVYDLLRFLRQLQFSTGAKGGGNLISRQAAIDALLLDPGSEEWQLEAIKNLPSAQLAQDLPNGCTDTISRAAVVDAIDGVDWYHMTDSGEMVHGANSAEHQAWYKAEDIYKAIEALPSAQTELENKIRAIGYTGREGRIYIGGRLFAVRELPQ